MMSGRCVLAFQKNTLRPSLRYSERHNPEDCSMFVILISSSCDNWNFVSMFKIVVCPFYRLSACT